MIQNIFDQIKLICPECRTHSEEGTKDASLELKEAFVEKSGHIMSGVLSCPGCGHEYPIIHGVPCIIKDIDNWLAQQETDDEEKMMDIFHDFHYGIDSRPDWAENQDYWDSMIELAVENELVLDLGCSVGRYTFELARKNILAIGLDIRLSALKIAVEKQLNGNMPDNAIFIAGDALDPPFRAEYFGHITSLNLLDNVPYPLTLLGQMDALLRPGCNLILASPYEWRKDITPREEWLQPEQVKAALEGKEFQYCQFNYQIVIEADSAWTMKNHDRYYSHFISHVIKAKKLI